MTSTPSTSSTSSNLVSVCPKELGCGMLQELDRIKNCDLRILIFTATYFVIDGVTLTIRRLEGKLRSLGATVKIVSTVPDNISDPIDLQNIIIVPGIKIPLKSAGNYSFGVGLDAKTIAEIEEFRPNLVHFTVPDFVGLDGIKWCQRNNIAYIGTWHSNYVEYLKYYFLEWILSAGLNRYLRGFFEQIPTVYVPTQYMLKKMRGDWGYGQSKSELKEWGRGVDMEAFSPRRRSSAFRKSKGFNENDVVVLWHGRLVPEKRPDVWYSVVKRLQDEGLPVKPLVVGDGAYERNLATLNHVVCRGWMPPGEDLWEAIASSDILLFPSDVETFGNVTLEALSSGIPCIVEKNCGEHLIDNGVNGLTCPAGDIEAFYQATKKLVVDEHLRKEMAIAALKKAAIYDDKIILQQMAENYKEAIVRQKDPLFMKRFLETNEGTGRNILSILCCNYYFIKILAEPLLNACSDVQEGMEGCPCCCCTDATRNRLSNLFSFSSSTNLIGVPSAALVDEDEDIEVGITTTKKFDDHHKDRKKNNKKLSFPSSAWSCLSASALTRKLIQLTGLIICIGMIIILIYAAFTV